MNAIIVALTIFAAPVDVASNEPVTLLPESVITFTGNTEKQANANCARVEKALRTSNKLAYCDYAIVPDAE